MEDKDITLFANPRSSNGNESRNDDTPPDWFVKLFPGVGYYPHVKLGEAFVPYAFGSDTGALLIYPIFEDGNLSEPVRNLLAAKEDLQSSEPGTTVEMILVMEKGWLQGTKELEEQGIHCFDAPQFLAYSINFFSEANEQCRVGKMAFRNGDYGEAFAKLNVDNPTDPEVLYMLGYMYEHGQGVEQDRKKAHSYYWKATLQGDAPAHDALEDFLDDAKRKVEKQEEQIVDEIKAFTEQLLKDDADDEEEEDDDDEWDDEDEGMKSNTSIRQANGGVRRSKSNCPSSGIGGVGYSDEPNGISIQGGSVHISGNSVAATGGSVHIKGVSFGNGGGVEINVGGTRVSIDANSGQGVVHAWGVSINSGNSVIHNSVGNSRSRQSLYGMLAGSCSQNVIVDSGRTLEIAGSCTGNVRICSNGTLICHGSCSGNVEIERNGRFVCNGSMSGNIRNHGGFVEIRGSFSGRRTDS